MSRLSYRESRQSVQRNLRSPRRQCTDEPDGCDNRESKEARRETQEEIKLLENEQCQKELIRVKEETESERKQLDKKHEQEKKLFEARNEQLETELTIKLQRKTLKDEQTPQGEKLKQETEKVQTESQRDSLLEANEQEKKHVQEIKRLIKEGRFEKNIVSEK